MHDDDDSKVNHAELFHEYILELKQGNNKIENGI